MVMDTGTDGYKEAKITVNVCFIGVKRQIFSYVDVTQHQVGLLARLNATALFGTITSQQDKEQGSCCISEHASWSTLQP